jgi:peptide/nickel transport system substrate-binding protein
MPHRRNRSDGANESRRKFLKASGTGAVALSLAGCSGGETDQETTTTEETTEETTTDSDPATKTAQEENIPRGGTLVYGMASQPDTSNYLMSGSVYSAVALNLVYDFGIWLDPVDYTVRPWAFSDWELQKRDADKPEVVANVHTDGVTFNDGEDFTVEDAIFSYQYIIDNEVGEFSTVWDTVESIQEDGGDWDVRMTLTQQIGTWEIDALGSAPMLPKHIWENVDDHQAYDPMAERENGPVGTGPGVLTQFQPDTSMQIQFRDPEEYPLTDQDWMAEHPNLVTGGPFLDQINYKIFGEQSAMTQAIMRGEIDTHYGTLKTDRIPEAKESDDLNLVNGFDSGFSYWAYNCRRQPLDDVAVRQAIAMAFDDYYWVQELQQGYVHQGDFSQSPGYSAVRPETVFDGELLSDPATDAFTFRNVGDSADVDVEAIRGFLTDGQVIDGTQGTYAGQEYPGSLSGTEASQSESKYEYTFEEAQSSELNNLSDKELYVDGEPLSSVMDGPLTVLMDPPADSPKQAQAFERWAENLNKVGIPTKLEPVEFNTMTGRVYYDNPDYDIYEMGWAGTGVYGTSTRSFFHSQFAAENTGDEAFSYNSTGYGVAGGNSDEIISDAHTTLDPEARNEKYATAIEKVYLDSPYSVRGYDKVRWPLSSKFTGAVSNVVDPAYGTWSDQVYQLHLNE